MTYKTPAELLEYEHAHIIPYRGRDFMVCRDDGHIQVATGNEYTTIKVDVTWSELYALIENYRPGVWQLWHSNQL